MQGEPAWLTLAEAGEGVRITEIGADASVSSLRGANLGDLPLLLLDGEQLVGVKRNHILNATVLVAAIRSRPTAHESPTPAWRGAP
jgi:hypothetical protein